MENLLDQDHRAEMGVTATLVRQGEHNEVCRSIVVGGLPRTEAYLFICLLAEKEGWLVRTLSTPDTILRDLLGPRVTPRNRDAVQYPEMAILARIGYGHLAENQPQRPLRSR